MIRIALALICLSASASGLQAVEEETENPDYHRVQVEIRGRLQYWPFPHGTGASSYIVITKDTEGEQRFALDLADPAALDTAKALIGQKVIITGNGFSAREVGDGHRRETTWIELFVKVGKITPTIPSPQR